MASGYNRAQKREGIFDEFGILGELGIGKKRGRKQHLNNGTNTRILPEGADEKFRAKKKGSL